MVLVGTILALLLITVVSFILGALGLSKYAFRMGTGPGLMVLLCPPYTFYFAFYKLQQENKDRATAMWLFGLVASIFLIGLFWVPLLDFAKGNANKWDPPPVEHKKLEDQKLKKSSPSKTPKVSHTPKVPKTDESAQAAEVTNTNPSDTKAADAAKSAPGTAPAAASK